MKSKKKSTKEKDSRLRLSPSAINTYYRCPRVFYYNYILKKRTPPNIHLYKGSFVHKVLEDMFDSTRYVDPEEYVAKAMTKWKIPRAIMKRLDDPTHHTNEAKKMLELFAKRLEDKLDMVAMEKKINGINHAWNMVRPKMREQRIYDDELHLVGVIDSIEKDYNDNVYLVDYKTSKLYRNTMKESYIRQVKIYAYLYFKEFGEMPDYVAVNYLRYGEIFIVPVYDAMLDEVRDIVNEVREGASSRNIEDYPSCGFDWCDCNYFDEKNLYVNTDKEDEEE